MNEIKEIVFYENLEVKNPERKACIVYENGKLKKVSYADGINTCYNLIKINNITTDEKFNNFMNNYVQVMSEKRFNQEYNIEKNDNIADNKIGLLKTEVLKPVVKPIKIKRNDDLKSLYTFKNKNKEIKPFFTSKKSKKESKLSNEKINIFSKIKSFFTSKKSKKESKLSNEKINIFSKIKSFFTSRKAKKESKLSNEKENVFSKIKSYFTSKKKTNSNKIRKINKKQIPNKIMSFKNKAITTTLASALILGSSGGAVASALTNKSSDDNSSTSTTQEFKSEDTVDDLLNETTNSTQKTAMTNLYSTITTFNGKFASAHMEDGKDIRAALSFDEVSALQVAYNDYTKDELKSIFNGADIYSKDLTNAYKDATLQLMGAYVIETPESPVDMSYLLETQEAKDYYNKMHKMFMEANSATGQEKLDKINAFYERIRCDFPITEEVRTEGISHADARNSIESYKLSVVPMVAAGEIMWQNLDVDLTLDNTSIDWLNDTGLCNYAEEKFARVETITLTSDTDFSNPTYEEYRRAINNYLDEYGINIINDEHRELSKLDAFQSKVNYNFEKNAGNFTYTSGTCYSSSSYQTTSSYTTSSTTYRSVTTKEAVSEDQVPTDERERLKSQIDSGIEFWNAKSKASGERTAEQNRLQIQAKEDENAKKIEQEVQADQKQLQQDINEANNQINKNNSDNDKTNDKKVNEKDFSGNVDFDKEHSDAAGNLDDSVKDITTDASGADQKLPDPNDTGAEFDKKAESTESTTESTTQVDENNVDTPAEETNVPSYPTESTTSSSVEDSTPSYPTETTSSSSSAESSSSQTDDYDEVVEVDYDEAVDAYVESLAQQQDNNEESYQYTLQ